MAGADPLLFVGKNLHVIGTKVGSLLDTDMALRFAARVSSISSPLSSRYLAELSH